MISKNYLGLAGSVLVISGTLLPMVHLPIIGNWNYLDIDIYLASIVLVAALTGLLSSIFDKRKVISVAGWVSLVMIIFTFIAVYLKAHDYFNFLLFKKLQNAAAGVVKYRWAGWSVLLTGSVLMIVEGRKKMIEASGLKASSRIENEENFPVNL